MNQRGLIFKQSARYFILKLRRYSPAVILVTIIAVTLLGNIQINGTYLLGVKRLLPRNEPPAILYTIHREYELDSEWGNSSTGWNNTKLLTDRDGGFVEMKHQASMGKAFPDDMSEKLTNINIYPTEGYKRAAFLRNKCASFDKRQFHRTVRVSYDVKHKALYCPLCKLASTFWTRVFKMLDNNSKGRFTRHPFEVPISQAPASKLYFDILDQKIGKTVNAKESFRFLFVRNPFSLLFSAFVDKIVGPNPSLWKIFKNPASARAEGKVTNTCGADLTFEQFLRNIVQRYKLKHTLDCHVAKFDACQPCAVNYTFVAKMETFKADTFHIMSKVNQTQTLEIFEHEFSSLHADDAIDDSTSGPFSWKGDIIRCITWPEALQRIWRKLQIRGIIGVHGFPLTDNEANTIPKHEFIALLEKTRLKTTSSERGWLKEQAFREAYRSVPINVLDEIRKIYSNEFSLFDYNDSPGEIFNIDIEIQNYRLLDYTNIKENITLRH
ncbi:carbohydrate sulfotransferase 9-like [Mercenaria mercenaria]|uniref:carbohydrate sulfotransferase 9-like n=1 Tax=Mercenaria mercenaria TaxID=6596 RepID=UPI00234ECA60|nr:carbohydrate sulfotransferase 9-like [Mercenaria mercenaria]